MLDLVPEKNQKQTVDSAFFHLLKYDFFLISLDSSFVSR